MYKHQILKDRCWLTNLDYCLSSFSSSLQFQCSQWLADYYDFMRQLQNNHQGVIVSQSGLMFICMILHKVIQHFYVGCQLCSKLQSVRQLRVNGNIYMFTQQVLYASFHNGKVSFSSYIAKGGYYQASMYKRCILWRDHAAICTCNRVVEVSTVNHILNYVVWDSVVLHAFFILLQELKNDYFTTNIVASQQPHINTSIPVTPAQKHCW